MMQAGSLVRLEATAGKEAEVESFLQGGLAAVRGESATAHLFGRVAAALMARAPELLSSPPSIEKVEVLAVKLPA